jgi:hypothetical protein
MTTPVVSLPSGIEQSEVGQPRRAADSEPIIKTTSVFYMKSQPLYKLEKPYFLNVPVDTGSDLPQTNVNYTRSEIRVTDVRPQKDKFTLDEHGFQVGKLQTALSYDDFANFDKIGSHFYPEVQQFLRDTLGAAEVFTFDFQVRRRDPELPRNSRGAPGKAQPFGSVHAGESLYFDFDQDGLLITIQTKLLRLHCGDFNTSIPPCTISTRTDGYRL